VSDIEGFFAAIGDYRLTYLAAGFAIHRDILRRATDFPDAVAASRFRFLRTSQGRLAATKSRLEAIFAHRYSSAWIERGRRDRA
jgi:hypothetical protein